jgi:hypothetical protein
MGVGGQHHAQATLSPRRRPSTPSIGWVGWFGWVRKISPSLGFDLWTVQPIASRYTDSAIPAHMMWVPI